MFIRLGCCLRPYFGYGLASAYKLASSLFELQILISGTGLYFSVFRSLAIPGANSRPFLSKQLGALWSINLLFPPFRT